MRLRLIDRKVKTDDKNEKRELRESEWTGAREAKMRTKNSSTAEREEGDLREEFKSRVISTDDALWLWIRTTSRMRKESSRGAY